MALSRRSVLARLKKLLKARDLATIESAVELARSLGDPSIWTELLDGVGWDPAAGTDHEETPWGRLVPNPIFRSTRPGRPWAEVALLLFLLAAPEHPLHARITHLELGSTDWRVKQQPTLALTGLERLTALDRLRIRHRAPIRSLAPLAGCPALTRVEVEASAIEQGLTGLGATPKLETLVLSAQVPDLAGLAGAPGLKRLVIGYRHGVPLDISALAGLPVEELNLMGPLQGTRALGQLPRLRSLVVSQTAVFDTGVLEGSPLEELTLERVRAPGRLPGLAQLRRLKIFGPPGDAQPFTLAAQPALEQLELGQLTLTVEPADAPGAEALDVEGPDFQPPGSNSGAPALPALRWCSIQHLRNEDADFLRHAPGLTHLLLIDWAALRDADALADLVELKWLNLPRRSGLTVGVPPLAGPVQLLWRYSKPHDVKPLSGLVLALSRIEELGAVHLLQGLSYLSLEGCTELTSLVGIERCPQLRALDLRGCRGLTDLDPLFEAPDLRQVAIRDSAFTKQTAPPALKPLLSSARGLDVQEALKRPRPTIDRDAQRGPSRIPVREALRPVWEAVQRGLATDQRTGLEELLQLLAQHPDPQLFEQLLSGVRLSGAGFVARGRMTRVGRWVRPWFLARLVALAPEGSATGRSLREAVERLELTGLVVRGTRDRWGDLRGLDRFPRLKELDYRYASQLAGVETLNGCGALEVCSLQGLRRPDLTGLTLPRLRSLTLKQHRLERLDGLEGLPALRTLRLEQHSPLRDIGALAGRAFDELLLDQAHKVAHFLTLQRMERLTRLEVHHSDSLRAADLGPIPGLRSLSLKRVDIADWGPLQGLALASLSLSEVAGWRGLDRCRAEHLTLVLPASGTLPPLPQGLRRLTLQQPRGVQLSGLPDTLEELELNYARDVDLLDLRGLPRLRRLYIDSHDAFSLAGLGRLPALEEIDIGCRHSLDLSPLVGAPALRSIAVHRWKGRKHSIPVELQPLLVEP